LLDWIAGRTPGLVVPLTMGVLAVLALAEAGAAKRARLAPRTDRWATNLVLWLTGRSALALLAPAALASALLARISHSLHRKTG
jgi:hypothetical protein